jgi:hypothetical protein
MNTFVTQGLWILSALILFVVASVRFSQPPTNRTGTTFFLFYSGVGFYYALLIGLWLLVILMLTGSGVGLNQIGFVITSSIKENDQLSASIPVVAVLVIVVASQFKHVHNIDTAARKFCIALAAIPRQADQLAMGLAHGAEFRVIDGKLKQSISHEITEIIGGAAVNFENDGTLSARFTRRRRALLVIRRTRRHQHPPTIPD